jgi:hypothetical protein
MLQNFEVGCLAKTENKLEKIFPPAFSEKPR